MTTSARPKRTLIGIELYRLLAHEGHRIFSTERARELAPRVGLKESYLLECLHHLQRNDWIIPLRRGLYALSSTAQGVPAAHEFEVAMSLVKPAAISHWSAMHHHGLTEQAPSTIFVLTTTEGSVPRYRDSAPGRSQDGYRVGGIDYRFVQVKPSRFFGTEMTWADEARVRITDLERTLVDGLIMPRHFGDFAEVLHAFDVGIERVNIHRIAGYASRLDAAVVKRLGWALEQHDIRDSEVDWLHSIPIRGSQKLNPSGPSRGTYNRRWMLIENLPTSNRR